jgi:hypothetical protein
MVRLGYLDGTVDTLDLAGRYLRDGGSRLNIDIESFHPSLPILLYCDAYFRVLVQTVCARLQERLPSGWKLLPGVS